MLFWTLKQKVFELYNLGNSILNILNYFHEEDKIMFHFIKMESKEHKLSPEEYLQRVICSF